MKFALVHIMDEPGETPGADTATSVPESPGSHSAYDGGEFYW